MNASIHSIRSGCLRRAALRNLAVTVAIFAAFASVPMAARGAAPDFGPNVLVFSPSMPSADMQRQIDKVYALQQHSEFGTARYALLFRPGDYKVDVPVGFYTELASQTLFGSKTTTEVIGLTIGVILRPAAR